MKKTINHSTVLQMSTERKHTITVLRALLDRQQDLIRQIRLEQNQIRVKLQRLLEEEKHGYIKRRS
ncbi:hypothetical protein QNI19_11240 [Cytophagaceae bacterium DM2B3-1]|uniref:Uncharacterized protein n=1 Tax=Xanthocytophaga flava TaxID=3048013 RepID=A0AAE3U5Z5_9BACT|nr:hypothetical protein [Xanthocytophaga flavus]MDJ1469562.1 hypothetical protein [Xanthocytophaga flavus]MDJ1480796.1 hypothetical protein [Xanthocytophaga flavus]MDJ1493508.1 hypothetical protein [Xanthocytophaga flavus]